MLHTFLEERLQLSEIIKQHRNIRLLDLAPGASPDFRRVTNSASSNRRAP
jgi:hypothetical protein